MPPEGRDARPRLFFYVQHLLGIGHLLRAARIVKALAADGFEVLLVLGGVADLDLDVGAAQRLQLPPVKAGPDGFAALVGADGTPFDALARAQRVHVLLDGFDRFAPDILVTEAFPFGRSQMRFELLPLLERARARARPPLIVASVRDILQRNRRAARVAETVDLVDRFFDLVLVHGDPRLTDLEATFPEAGRFADKLAYTGIVAPDPVAPQPGAAAPAYAAVVSAGGGAVGLPLLEAALRARPLTRIAHRPWLVVTGPNLPAETRSLLVRQAGPGLQIERFVPDLSGVLARAELSVSQAGYNTVADVLAGGCRAVLVPFAQDGETEQTDRADLLARREAAVVVPEADLTPGRLAAAIDQALTLPLVRQDIDLDGAAATARLIQRQLTIRDRVARAAHGAKRALSGGPSG